MGLSIAESPRKSWTGTRNSKIRDPGPRFVGRGIPGLNYRDCPGDKKIPGLGPGTENFPGHGPGPVPTPDWD